MQMFCAQAAYHQSTDQLFATHSLLKDKPLMSKERFTELWKVISVKYRVPNDEVCHTQSPSPLWMLLECIVNEELRKWSNEGHKNSLDDDKVCFLTKKILKICSM